MWHPAGSLTTVQAQALSILTTLGLADGAETNAEHLAHGEKRVLEIAIALALQPTVILLDEPTAGMSSGETERVAALIRGLAARASVLLVEHDMEIVLGISDVVTVMTQGAVIASGPPSVISRDARVQEAYLGAATENA
jgi:branched-chain amino acid transport system ATP-binding protein